MRFRRIWQPKERDEDLACEVESCLAHGWMRTLPGA